MFLYKSLPPPSSTRVPGLPSYETISRSIIFPFYLSLSRSGQEHSSLDTGKPASPSMVLCIMRACSCGELRPLVGATGRMKRVTYPPEVGTRWIRAPLEIAGDLVRAVPLYTGAFQSTATATSGLPALWRTASVRTRKPRASLRLPAYSGISAIGVLRCCYPPFDLPPPDSR